MSNAFPHGAHIRIINNNYEIGTNTESSDINHHYTSFKSREVTVYYSKCRKNPCKHGIFLRIF